MNGVLADLELFPVRIPMRHRFRRVDFRDVVLIRGAEGWGEFSPFPEYPPAVAVRWLRGALELATAALPPPGSAQVPVNVTIPALDPNTAGQLAARSGARVAKVKIGEPGHSEIDDIRRIGAVVDALGPGGSVRVDVNASWDVDTAAKRINALDRFDLEYVEQPVATVAELSELRPRINTPIAVDELIRLSDDPLAVMAAGVADVVIVKVQPLGGVLSTLALAEQCEVPVVVSSALETSVGMYGGLLAASIIDSAEGRAHGLGTVDLLAGDPTSAPLISESGYVRVRRPEPDPELVVKWKPDTDVTLAMLSRLDETARLIA